MSQRQKGAHRLKRAGISAIVAAIAALVIVAILSGGGGTQASRRPAPQTMTTAPGYTSSNESALSGAQWRARASSICNALPNPPQLGTSLQADAPVMKHLVLDLDQAIAELSALQPPPSLACQVEHALALARQEADVGAGIAGAASAGDEGAARTYAVQLTDVIYRAHAAWKRLGVLQCG